MKNRASNIKIQDNYNEMKNSADSYMKMSNGKNSIKEEDIINKPEHYFPREIIVKDVSTRDKRINVFIKYIEYHNQIRYIYQEHIHQKIAIYIKIVINFIKI